MTPDIRHVLFDADDVFQVGCVDDPFAITVHSPIADLAGHWRESGLTVHLATNQDAARAAYMKRSLGYDALLDGAFYSSDLGVSKPEAAFFAAILDDLAADPRHVLFVDDMTANVDAARTLGIHAVRWEIGDGMSTLRQRLTDVGFTA